VSIKFYYQTVLNALGIRPRIIFRRFKGLFPFKRSLTLFRSSCNWAIEVEPKLDDIHECAASLGEYFWQDLWVAKKIFELNPQRHIDVGSRIDGFVAHVACCRSIDVFDLRPLNSQIPGVNFHQINILSLPDKWLGVADCVTCLHTIEHFGLGRYGDKVDPEAWKDGFKNLSALLTAGGRLILSTPIGHERVKFNAHRIFDPKRIVEFSNTIGLLLESYAWCECEQNGSWIVKESTHPESDLSLTGRMKYAVGFFVFKKS